jgi:hypothetical protein
LDKVAGMVTNWGGDKVTVHVQGDSLGVKPIGELALAKIRVRSIVNYLDTRHLSTKRIIAHEAFDVKIGWDMNSDIAIVVHPATHTVVISAARPRILSVTHADEKPCILLSEDGVLNKLTPEDMVQVQNQLENGARASGDLREGANTAIDGFRRYFTALFQMEGYAVTFDFTGTNSLYIPPPAVPLETSP